MPAINNLEVQEFLSDFETMEVSFLEESQEKEDLFAIAKAKGILAKDSIDLALFKGVYDFTEIPNGNGKRVPKVELLKVLPGIIGKPVSIDHIRRYIVGFCFDYRYIQKDNKIIVYGCIFKNCFKSEYQKMVAMFKEKKLALSSEIWSPKSKREYLPDGTYKLHDMEMGGVTIIFVDKTHKPAMEECQVLELSKINYEENMELIYSSLNKENIKLNTNENSEDLILSLNEQPLPTSQPNKLKIICGQCSHNFEYLFVPNQTSSIKCPQCTSILDQTGKMLYPPQNLNFSLRCPNDGGGNWLLLESNDNSAKARCQSCGKEYDISFKQMPEDLKLMLNKIQFLHSGSAPCWQCGTYNNYTSLSNQEKVNLHCSKCGLDYTTMPLVKLKRDISTIVELIEKKEESKDKIEQKDSPTLELIMAELNNRKSINA
jgi:DNA-directed RNA polymerase subunit RPC12/RpoP